MEAPMTIMTQLEDLEAMITGGRVPGTARTLLNLAKVTTVINEVKAELPTQINEAEGIVRQKEAIIKQAELEARRIRAYADEEATTIRQLAEEQSSTLLTSSQAEAHRMVENTEITRVATENAAAIESEARTRAGKMIDDAENRVNGILNEANTQADQRRKGADNYVREVLFALEERVADTLGQVRGGIDLLDARPAVNVAD
jgi:vacuolar-type H+-ATPase subunit E/Vma4